MRAIMIFLILGTAEATIVEVNYRLLEYKIDFKNDYILYTSSDTNLSIQKKTCNEHILNSFRIQMKQIFKDNFLEKKIPNSYSLIIDGVKKYDSLGSARAQFFSNFHDYFKQVKIEEYLSCE